ncbi:hypothetical protein B7494_g4809 [Chlorociboria aeruginascens]|nr:hypothetical protein B7494_g4809 [Chlorociboria aeruginascens]
MASLKRASTMPVGPKSPTSFASTVIIADSAVLTGSNLIKLGANTVIHPRTKMNSTFGRVTIGNTCIISERSSIGLLSPPETAQDGVLIGSGVVVEVGATVEAASVGDGCLIEVNAKLGKGVVLGKHCKIGPLCEVTEGEVLPDFTVLFGNGMRRVDQSGVEELKLKMVGRQVEVLRKLIPSNLAKFQ